MKKLVSLTLALGLMLVLAACGGGNDQPAPTPTEPPVETPAPEEEPDTPEEQPEDEMPQPDADLAQLVEDIYAVCPVELMGLGTRAIMQNGEAAAYPFNDGDDISYARWMLGLQEDAWDPEVMDLVDAAVSTESEVGSFAYTMVLLRVKDAADAETVGAHFRDHAYTGKWTCVFPTAVIVSGYGDTVCFIMGDEEIVDPFALADAFAQAAGGEDFRWEDTDLELADAGMFGFELPEEGGEGVLG